jgi:repressor LexA
MTHPSLTERQAQLLRYIRHHIHSHGYPPTVREIARAFRFRSTGTVRDHLRALTAKGQLQPAAGKARGLLPVRWGRGLPVLGRVVAGTPLLADENIEGLVDLSEEFGGEQVFALKVRGDSMNDAGICDGDLVVVRAQAQVEPGHIVVAQMDGETTVKRLARRQQRLELQPANDRYEPIPVTAQTRVLGRVIGVIRSYERKW